MAVTEPQERDEIPVMRVSTTYYASHPGQRTGRSRVNKIIPRDFQVAEAGRLAYKSFFAATRAPCGSFVPSSRFLFPRGVILDLMIDVIRSECFVRVLVLFEIIRKVI